MMNPEALAKFKSAQREGWGLFAPLEAVTTMPAAALVRFARLRPGQTALDVGCGTGVVAVTAARAGARVRGLDLSPKLLERARMNAELAGVEAEFTEGDAEALPYEDASFDVVLSQFGHMFAPRPEVAIAEMLRVLKPGGRIAFSTWPPEHFVGKMFALVGKHMPPPEGVAPPSQWGNPDVVRARLGDKVTELAFDRGVMRFPTLSVGHYRASMEATLAPLVKLVEAGRANPEPLRAFRAELDAMLAEHLVDNEIPQHFLMTRALKR